jgi:hypothetical protein
LLPFESLGYRFWAPGFSDRPVPIHVISGWHNRPVASGCLSNAPSSASSSAQARQFPRLLAEQTSLRHLESGSVAFRSGVCVMAARANCKGFAFSELENMRFSFIELEFHGCAKMEH